ncbi:MAG: hypothetical protein R3193_11675 [Marinobacter sp.]|nr:hypothetical protein [Marinobacter sp.]
MSQQHDVQPGSDLAPPRAANDSSSTEASCADCQVEFVELLHITGEADVVHALTERQCNELNDAITELRAPLEKLQQAEGESQDRIPQAKAEVWRELKELDALPPTSTSNSAGELLQEYRGRWQHAQQRLDRQERRRDRIRREVEQLRREVLSPMYRRPTNDSKDQLTLRIFTRLSHELERTLPDIETVLNAHRSSVARQQRAFELLDERMEYLRAALEAEIAYRIEQASTNTSGENLAQLVHETRVLKEQTRWPDFISEADIAALVRRQERLNQIESTPTPSWWRSLADYFASSSPAPTVWSLVETEEVQQYRELQSEKERLLLEQDQALSNLVEGSPPSSNEVFASPNVGNTRAWNVVEVKRSGESGYRYIHREALEQLRRGWRPMRMADVREAMSANQFKGAGKEALNSLRTHRELNLKLADWKSKEDNFFNQLNIELFKEDVSTSEGRFSAAAEAQMFRFAAQAGLSASYNPVKQEAHIGGKMEGAYSLLEGKASLAAKFPNEDGMPFKLSYQDRKGELVSLHCGLIRTDADYVIQGFAGACASLGASVKVASAPQNIGISGESNGEAFVGGTLKNEAAFSVKWKAAYAEVQGDQAAGQSETISGEERERRDGVDKDFKSLLEVKPEIALSAGLGAGFEFKVGLSEEKRLYMTLKGHLVLGPGAGGGVAAELNGAQVVDLVRFIRWSLEQSDFRFLEWIDSEAFSLVSLMLRVQAVSGDELIDLASWPFDRLQDYWRAAQEDYLEAINAATRVATKDDVLSYTPEAKAEVLHLFSSNATRARRRNEDEFEQLASAAFAVLDTLKNHREFMEILRRMGQKDGAKGSVVDLKNNYVSLVVRFLYHSPSKARDTEQWLSTLYS